jgi:hypothetical protein
LIRANNLRGGIFSGLRNILGANCYSAVLGGCSNVIANSADYGVIGGGETNAICGTTTHGFLGGGSANRVCGNYASVVGGGSNCAIGTYGFIGSGCANTVSNFYGVILNGSLNQANGNYSTVINGSCNRAIEGLTIASGQYACARLYGERAHTQFQFAAIGDAQHVELVVGNKTVNSTPQILYPTYGSSITNITIPNGAMLMGTIATAGIISTGATVATSYDYFVIKNVGGSTTLPHQNVIASHFGAVGYSITIGADNVNDSLTITVAQPVGAITTRWTAVIQGVMLFYGT